MGMIADRVVETSQTLGTGSYSLEGPATGQRSFVAAHGDGAQVWYTAQRQDGTKIEFGIGTLTAGTPDSLSRDSIISSSNADAAVDWQAGDLPVYIYTAAPGQLLDKLAQGRATYLAGGGTANAITATPSPKWTGYIDGNAVDVKLTATNTSSTVVANVSGLGNKSVKLPGGGNPPIGGLVAGNVVRLRYVASSDILIAVSGVELRPRGIGTAVASAATLALAGDGDHYDVSGTATITAVTGHKAGDKITLRATGGWTIVDDGDNIIIDPLAGGGSYVMGVDQESVWRFHADNKITFVGGHTLVAGQSTMEAAASNLLAGTPGRQHFHPGHPKAFVKFNGTGTPAISRAYNVSSITDRGTGLYTANLSITLSGTDAAAIVTVFDDSAADNPNRNGVAKVASTTTVQIGTGQPATAANEDYAHISLAVWGDI